MKPTKPLLLIDVDGPLNPYAAKPQRRPEGYTTHRMRPTGWTGAESAKPLRVWLNHGHGAELLALAEAYELVWATTWKDEANDWIGPHLGLPRLPYIDWPVMHGRAPRGTFWKTQYVLEYAAGRPFAWIDDDITAMDREYVEQRHPAHALLMYVDERIGLTRADFDALARWAAWAA
ncbi:HAD domain-containing protein [Streptomyces sp. NBC_01408]|uniref:HAD domain-containing protein n=1 Tax=Streptomyces sp. NBC_01408 TaxID=2903855 RepID=UPI002255CEB9|nr:HAD domain-containing protein [Streptomyces sp. NBC_01408]MCX4694319.1 HAD domain-containing protein [Streptomyces sp. NBC_01408]